MSLRLTPEQYDAIVARQNLPQVPARAKYGNVRVEYDGHKFDSKRERDHYIKLERLKAAKMIRGFAHQVSIPLPSGKRRMRIDFMIVEKDGRIRWEDSKGHATKDWLVKRDELQHALGIEIACV